jgi:hypothetical protein
MERLPGVTDVGAIDAGVIDARGDGVSSDPRELSGVVEC